MSVQPQTVSPIRAGFVDWINHWRDKVEARQAADRARTGPEDDRWARRAGRFARMARTLDPAADPFVQALQQALRPTDTVLDVGAGAGRYALALAPMVAGLTAVEPSAGMRAQLDRQIADRGLTNLRVVPGAWQEVEVEAHDVVFVSHVLYFVPDAVSFLQKLDRSAARACFILHRVEEIGSLFGPLQEELFGGRPPEAGFLDLYNLLFAIGIRPNARLFRQPFSMGYGSMDEAVSEARSVLGLPPGDDSHDARIRAYLSGALVERNGDLCFPGGPQLAIIWWEKG